MLDPFLRGPIQGSIQLAVLTILSSIPTTTLTLDQRRALAIFTETNNARFI